MSPSAELDSGLVNGKDIFGRGSDLDFPYAWDIWSKAFGLEHLVEIPFTELKLGF